LLITLSEKLHYPKVRSLELRDSIEKYDSK
jgi:hypothetical protein